MVTSTSYAGLAADAGGHPDARPALVLLHGMTFDRTMWRPALTELATIDPGRQTLALDLPGHGESADASSYSMTALVDHVHAAILEAHLDAPVLVGHSAGAGTASAYAAQYPTRGVVAVEGTLGVGAFASMAQAMQAALRSPAFGDIWGRIASGAFRLDEVTPEVRAFVGATSRPRQDIVLGYWQDLFDQTPQELDARVVQGAAAIRASGIPFVGVVGQEPSPEDLAWLKTNLPTARTLVWPASGHFPHLAHPRQFAELLAETGTWVGPLATAASS